MSQTAAGNAAVEVGRSGPWWHHRTRDAKGTGFSMPQTPPLMITNEHVNLLSVSGRMDGTGLLALQQQINLLLDAGARFLLTDLSRAEHCDRHVFDLLARTNTLIQQRGGWLRLVTPGTSHGGAVEETTLTKALPMDPTSDRADRAIGYA
jgi:anti-anti-sigma regulatory factor